MGNQLSIRDVEHWLASSSANGYTAVNETDGLAWSDVGARKGRHRATVLLFPGIGGGRFAALVNDADLREAGFRGIMFDYPGVGGSTPVKRRTLAGWCEAVAAFVRAEVDNEEDEEDEDEEEDRDEAGDEAGAEEKATAAGSGGATTDDAACAVSKRKPLFIIGASAGGLHAMAVASALFRSPTSPQIDGIALIAPWVPPSWASSRWFASVGSWTPEIVLRAFSGVIPRSQVSAVTMGDPKRLAKAVGLDEDALSEAWHHLAKAMFREANRVSTAGFHETLQVCLEKHTPVPPELVDAIDCKVFLFAAANDGMVSVDALRAVAARMPNVDFHLVAGVDHAGSPFHCTPLAIRALASLLETE